MECQEISAHKCVMLKCVDISLAFQSQAFFFDLRCEKTGVLKSQDVALKLSFVFVFPYGNVSLGLTSCHDLHSKWLLCDLN